MAQKNTKKSTRVASKKTSKLILPFRLPELPVPLARAIIFVLFFANIGVAYLLFSQAGTYNVRFVYFCASNACSGSYSASTLNTSAGQIQTWYGQKLGKTFTRLTTVKVVGSQPASYYYGGGSYNSVNTYNNVYKDLSAKGYINSNTKVVVQLGFRSMANCGIASYDGPLALADPQKGCSSIQASVLAHELGHSFRLATTSSMHRTDGTLMHEPLACNGAVISSCTLNSSDRSWLLGSRAYWFPTSTSTTTTTTSSSPYVESSSDPYRASCTTPTHQTLKQGNSGNCVKHLQWLLVNKWSTHGGSQVSNSGGIDGGFGSGTTQAVKTFQSYKGLTADGVVGPKTWDALH